MCFNFKSFLQNQHRLIQGLIALKTFTKLLFYIIYLKVSYMNYYKN